LIESLSGGVGRRRTSAVEFKDAWRKRSPGICAARTFPPAPSGASLERETHPEPEQKLRAAHFRRQRDLPEID